MKKIINRLFGVCLIIAMAVIPLQGTDLEVEQKSFVRKNIDKILNNIFAKKETISENISKEIDNYLATLSSEQQKVYKELITIYAENPELLEQEFEEYLVHLYESQSFKGI